MQKPSLHLLADPFDLNKVRELWKAMRAVAKLPDIEPSPDELELARQHLIEAGIIASQAQAAETQALESRAAAVARFKARMKGRGYP